MLADDGELTVLGQVRQVVLGPPYARLSTSASNWAVVAWLVSAM